MSSAFPACEVQGPSPYVGYLSQISVHQACVSRRGTGSCGRVRNFYQHLYASFPILPPEANAPSYLDFVGSRTPVMLAIQALAVLVPSIAVPFADRHGASVYLAARASEAIDDALAQAAPTLDVIQALYLLSVWNWGEGGRPCKSRTLAIQALQLGMEVGLHQVDRRTGTAPIDTTWYKVTCRRTWWASFALHTTLSVVASTEPMIELRDHRLHTAYPSSSSTPDVWKDYVEAAHRCATVTNEIEKVLNTQTSSNADLEASLRRLLCLDDDIQHQLAIGPFMDFTSLNDPVAFNLQFTARLGLSTSIIHLHRHQAFSDVAVYSRDTCGLQKGSSVGMVNRIVGNLGHPVGEGSISVLDPPDPFESFIDLGVPANEVVELQSVMAPVNDEIQQAIAPQTALSRTFPPVISMQRCAAAATDVAQSLHLLREQTRSK